MVAQAVCAANTTDNDKVLCWDSFKNASQKYSQKFINITSCINPVIPGIDDSFSICSKMMIAFGGGSAMVLTITVAKLIYNQCKGKGPKKFKGVLERQEG